jgi:archaellum component FlaC
VTPEERFNLIEENLAQVSVNLTTASKLLVELDERTARTDERINRLFTITLKIGADFAERIKALEEKERE